MLVGCWNEDTWVECLQMEPVVVQGLGQVWPGACCHWAINTFGPQRLGGWQCGHSGTGYRITECCCQLGWGVGSRGDTTSNALEGGGGWKLVRS